MMLDRFTDKDRGYRIDDVRPLTLSAPVSVSMWNRILQQYNLHQFPEGYWPEKELLR